jgi:hypothetical protein
MPAIETTPITFASLAPALPEIYLTVMICAVLMVDVFAADSPRRSR